MSVGIYTITSPTNKVYVGQSWELGEREKDYRGADCKGQHRIYNSIKKYGWSTHKFEVALELRDDISQETLDCWEGYYYELYKGKGYEMLNLMIPDGAKGRHSEESKQKISIKNKTSRKLRGVEHYLFGKKFSDEYRKKLSDAHKGKFKGSTNPKAVAIIQYSKSGEFVREWGSIAEAADEIGGSRPHICSVCKGKRKTSGGFIWKYKEIK